MATRQEVYEVIDAERDYQDRLPPERTDGKPKSVGEYLTLLRYGLSQADEKWATHAGHDHALHELRKVGAILVRCLEDHGVPERTP